MMLPQVWTDILVVIAMFVLRIVVPVALTIALGKWLEKKLAPREMNQKQTDHAALNPKIIQLHCWDVKRCAPAIRAQCAASKHPELPCWLAIQTEGGTVRPECFSCALYKPLAKVA
jgi:hypothetical protein